MSVSTVDIWSVFVDIVGSIRLFYGVLVGFLLAATVAGISIGTAHRAAAGSHLSRKERR